MSEQPDEFPQLSEEQLAALSEEQLKIFQSLDEKDRQFFADNFSPETLALALERKGDILEARARRKAFDQSVKQKMAQAEAQGVPSADLSAKDLGVSAAGVAGAVGMGVLAGKIAPEGKATWRGVEPNDLVNPLVETFARQESTDIRFQTPSDEGVRQAVVLLRTPQGLVPGLTIILSPLQNGTQVQVSKLSSEGLMQTLREGGLRLIDLVSDGLRRRRSGSPADWVDMVGKAIDSGVDIAQMVKDLDLEDKAWEAIKNAADPIQAIYDERMAIERVQRLKLEALWDDYYSCPKCRVEFGAEDTECRVCGAERPPMPEDTDPRRAPDQELTS